MLKKYDDLPAFMKTPEVLEYYKQIEDKKISLFCKRVFDILIALLLIAVLAIPMVVVAMVIKLDSKGTILFRQTRVTQYGREFKIYKFRTMVENAQALGAQVTVENDERITNVGKKIRKIRLDEMPQVFNVLIGDMTMVGTRPEVPKYTAQYTNKMNATLLMPAGVTSLASIAFRDEDEILNSYEDTEKAYIEVALPQKMNYNLAYVSEFSFKKDMMVLMKTILAIFDIKRNKNNEQ